MHFSPIIESYYTLHSLKIVDMNWRIFLYGFWLSFIFVTIFLFIYIVFFLTVRKHSNLLFAWWERRALKRCFPATRKFSTWIGHKRLRKKFYKHGNEILPRYVLLSSEEMNNQFYWPRTFEELFSNSHKLNLTVFSNQIIFHVYVTFWMERSFSSWSRAARDRFDVLRSVCFPWLMFSLCLLIL